MKPKHSIQPLVIPAGEDKRPRFWENAIVLHLLTLCEEAGITDLNEIHADARARDGLFSKDDYQHFLQLIGWTVEGYAKLTRIHDKRVLEHADDEVARLQAAKVKAMQRLVRVRFGQMGTYFFHDVVGDEYNSYTPAPSCAHVFDTAAAAEAAISEIKARDAASGATWIVDYAAIPIDQKTEKRK